MRSKTNGSFRECGKAAFVEVDRQQRAVFDWEPQSLLCLALQPFHHLAKIHQTILYAYAAL